MQERTLSIIKPDAVSKGHIGEILARFEKAGLQVIACKMVWLTGRNAETFYAVHRQRPFFKDLVTYMTSGPAVVSVLEGTGAINRNREIMGATDPAKAAAGTIRRDYGESIERNAVHGSDGPDTARIEIAHFFSTSELHSYERVAGKAR
jgi:nucleoside-diphosphate kinase